MAGIRCPFPDCIYRTDSTDAVLAAAQLNIHALIHNRSNMNIETKQRPPKIERPSISRGSTEEEWNLFIKKWTLFKNGTSIPPTQLTTQLWQCCDSELEADLFRDLDNIGDMDETLLSSVIKKLAVISVAASVRRAELLALKQDHGQAIRSFAAQAKGKAQTCVFKKRCTRENCNTDIDYTDDMVKYVVISGISDDDIKKDILSYSDLDDKSLNDTISLIESKEMAVRAMSARVSDHLSLVAATGYKQPASMHEKLAMKTVCRSCAHQMQRFTLFKGRNGKSGKLREFTQCKECWMKSKPQYKSNESGIDQLSTGALFDLVTAITVCERAGDCVSGSKHEGSDVVGAFHLSSHASSVVLDHQIFDGTDGWKTSESKKQPSLELMLSTNRADYDQLRVPYPQMNPSKVVVITDTGAQSSLMGLKVFLASGFSLSHLIPVTKKMYAANNEGIEIVGAVLVRLSGLDSQGRNLETAEMVYVTDSTSLFYLSRHAMEKLRIIGPDFPRVGGVIQAAVEDKGSPNNAECGCPIRQKAPTRPKSLPFEAIEENIPRMKQWLLVRNAASTFNKCPHQKLLFMRDDPPMAVYVDPDAPPSVIHTPATSPIHWREEIKEQLDVDVKLGVIEKLEPNTPVTWCHRAFWTAKTDGSPRRVVDLQKLNKHCIRDTHHVVPPFQQARTIPPKTWRTVTDAWSGYHSVLLREEDRHYFTFITEEGRFRYCVAPQGYKASGDAYCHRYDRVIAEVLRKTKVIDDTVLWDEAEALEEHWWRTIDFLDLCANAGIVLNPLKFQFCEREINFAGFRITEEEVKPLPKYLDSIRNFPRPQKIGHIRAWFGLVNQVAHYGKLIEIMAPFKPLLSPKTPFRWDDVLEDAFQASKVELVKAIEHGVQIFDPTRKTCLSPDWSKVGIGYWLRQKYCDCISETPDCCHTGWKITLAGSRFLRGPEQRYAPVEGEALAVAWALEDTRFFTMGCTDLIVATDHKPLVKILGDRALDEITNTRIFRLKQRTLMWNFKIAHVPGKSIPASDAASRNPCGDSVDSLAAFRIVGEYHPMEEEVVASNRSSLEKVKAVTWERVRKTTQLDPEMLCLVHLIENGFPNTREEVPPEAQSYWQYRDKLSVVDNVVMFGDRVVIPFSLRSEVCSSLHAAHQGTTGMSERAKATVFWPGVTEAIRKTREQCDSCWRMAPSQPHLPPVDTHVPTSPFEAVAADYCTVGGYYYLITVDRFSNWPDIKQVVQSSRNSGAAGLIRALKRLFATFGVPRELSSDGGPEFTAKETLDFLQRWGVSHRLSSAYNPRSNGRAEVAVKSMKRLLQGNVSPSGEIDSEGYIRAILQFRNTPDPMNGISPSEVVFGRPLRDVLPVKPGTQIFQNGNVRPVWKEIWKKREDTLRARFGQQTESLRAKTRELSPLKLGDGCRIQNQTGRFANRWDRTGQVVQVGQNDQYVVKVGGSGRLTLRNRRHLRRVEGLKPHWETGSPYVAERRCDTKASDAQHVWLAEETPVPTGAGHRQLEPEDVSTEASHPVSNIEATQVSEEVAREEEMHEKEAGGQQNDLPIPVVTENRSFGPVARPKRAVKVPKWHEDYEVSGLQCIEY